MIARVLKRDGRQVPFNIDKIATAIRKAFEATGEANGKAEELSLDLAVRTGEYLELQGISIPRIEEIQDMVEHDIPDNFVADRLLPCNGVKFVICATGRRQYRGVDACFRMYAFNRNILGFFNGADHALWKTPFIFFVAHQKNCVIKKNNASGTISYQHSPPPLSCKHCRIHEKA